MKTARGGADRPLHPGDHPPPADPGGDDHAHPRPGGPGARPPPLRPRPGLPPAAEALERVAHLVDGIEVFNARTTIDGDNHQAVAFARRHGLLQTAGSDAHVSWEVGHAYVALDEPPATTPEAFLGQLRRGTDRGAPDATPSPTPSAPWPSCASASAWPPPSSSSQDPGATAPGRPSPGRGARPHAATERPRAGRSVQSASSRVPAGMGLTSVEVSDGRGAGAGPGRAAPGLRRAGRGGAAAPGRAGREAHHGARRALAPRRDGRTGAPGDGLHPDRAGRAVHPAPGAPPAPGPGPGPPAPGPGLPRRARPGRPPARRW